MASEARREAKPGVRDIRVTESKGGKQILGSRDPATLDADLKGKSLAGLIRPTSQSKGQRGGNENSPPRKTKDLASDGTKKEMKMQKKTRESQQRRRGINGRKGKPWTKKNSHNL